MRRAIRRPTPLKPALFKALAILTLIAVVGAAGWLIYSWGRHDGVMEALEVESYYEAKGCNLICDYSGCAVVCPDDGEGREWKGTFGDYNNPKDL